jgi:hypothetical protein
MGIHAGNKGKTGEREICDHLRTLIYTVCKTQGSSDETLHKLWAMVERNQNQSASGGADIILMGLAIEVKRQETLSIPAWWRQATESASRLMCRPVLIYRQNRKAWHVVVPANVPLLEGSYPVQSTLSFESFSEWFKLYLQQWMKAGGLV